MAAFYLDNDVSDDLVGLLRAKKHDVLHTRPFGQARATDDRQLLTAFRLGRILVTHNARDFILVHHAWLLWPPALGVGWPRHFGVLIVPQPPDLSTHQVAEAIDRFVRAQRPLADELYRLTVPGGWQRQRRERS